MVAACTTSRKATALQDSILELDENRELLSPMSGTGTGCCVGGRSPQLWSVAHLELCDLEQATYPVWTWVWCGAVPEELRAPSLP